MPKSATKKTIAIPEHPRMGLFHIFFRRKRQPSPGAMAYAYESLGLADFTPIGPGITIRDKMDIVPPYAQSYVGKAVSLAGIPTVSGQIYGQPLFNPETGYTKSNSPLMELPYPRSEIAPAGSVIT